MNFDRVTQLVQFPVAADPLRQSSATSLRVTSEKFFGCLLICRVIKRPAH